MDNFVENLALVLIGLIVLGGAVLAVMGTGARRWADEESAERMKAVLAYEQLLATGEAAKATVVRSDEAEWTVGDVPVIRLVLDVRRADGVPYRPDQTSHLVKLETTVPALKFPQ